jgi:hypothetical protein
MRRWKKMSAQGNMGWPGKDVVSEEAAREERYEERDGMGQDPATWAINELAEVVAIHRIPVAPEKRE